MFLNFARTDSREFSQSVEHLTFFNDTSNMSGRECYNITVVRDIPCKYCSSAYLLSQWTTDSNYVRIDRSEVRIYIQEDLMQCGM